MSSSPPVWRGRVEGNDFLIQKRYWICVCLLWGCWYLRLFLFLLATCDSSSPFQHRDSQKQNPHLQQQWEAIQFGLNFISSPQRAFPLFPFQLAGLMCRQLLQGCDNCSISISWTLFIDMYYARQHHGLGGFTCRVCLPSSRTEPIEWQSRVNGRAASLQFSYWYSQTRYKLPALLCGSSICFPKDFVLPVTCMQQACLSAARS